ncbi:MAG: BspA family leucine-rich repeat surface protein [Spirochaetales bacterium]|nr:BspA family leucine-rich repeat surface protein [Spirochaetales bacterium]
MKKKFSLLFFFLVFIQLFIISCDNPQSSTPLSPVDSDKIYYTVSYNNNGADSGTVPQALAKEAGGEIEIAFNTGDLEKGGYDFNGWNTKSDGSGTSYSPGDIYTEDISLLLYAQWLPELPKYTITYIKCFPFGGIGTAPAPQIKTQGIDITLSGNTGNLRAGFSGFVGWNTKEDGTGTDYNGGSVYSEDEDLTLYPKAREAFVTIWNTTSANETIIIPVNPDYNYNYYIDWDDGSTDSNITGDITHTYEEPGRYLVNITGDFPAIFFKNSTQTNAAKLYDVYQWGPNKWQSMEGAFYNCTNLELIYTEDKPDLSETLSTSYMFYNADSLNQSIDTWTMTNIRDMSGMFYDADTFNQPLNSWDVSNVTNMSGMFAGAEDFNQPLNSWITNNVTDMRAMFETASSFNADISSWNTSRVTDMSYMFYYAGRFNSNIGSWTVSNVKSMAYMFGHAGNFNQNLASWITTSAENMEGMFWDAGKFNQNISSWTVGNVENMSGMFFNAKAFNQEIGFWNVSKVRDMGAMFQAADSFNGDISGWIVPNVTDMSSMFSYTDSFNQNISGWDVHSVSDMSSMFYMAKGFTNQDLSGWDVDYSDDDRTEAVEHNDFSWGWGTGNTEPIWIP